MESAYVASSDTGTSEIREDYTAHVIWPALLKHPQQTNSGMDVEVFVGPFDWNRPNVGMLRVVWHCHSSPSQAAQPGSVAEPGSTTALLENGCEHPPLTRRHDEVSVRLFFDGWLHFTKSTDSSKMQRETRLETQYVSDQLKILCQQGATASLRSAAMDQLLVGVDKRKGLRFVNSHPNFYYNSQDPNSLTMRSLKYTILPECHVYTRKALSHEHLVVYVDADHFPSNDHHHNFCPPFLAGLAIAVAQMQYDRNYGTDRPKVSPILKRIMGSCYRPLPHQRLAWATWERVVILFMNSAVDKDHLHIYLADVSHLLLRHFRNPMVVPIETNSHAELVILRHSPIPFEDASEFLYQLDAAIFGPHEHPIPRNISR